MLGLMIGLIIAGVVGGALLALLPRDHDISLDRAMHDKLRELPLIFEGAQRTIKIATDFDPRFFEKQRVINAFEKALTNGAEIQFISEGDPPQWYKKKEGIEIKRVKRVSCHLMVVDDHNIRLEHPHEPGKFGADKLDGALIFKEFPLLGQRYSKEFDELWRQVS